MFGAAYLVLRPSPHASDLAFLPTWLATWLDENYDLRTFFLTVSVAVGPALLFPVANARRKVLAGVLVCLLILEFSQLLIETRHFSTGDVIYTVAGVAATELLATLLYSRR